jgi:hypothetical protein
MSAPYQEPEQRLAGALMPDFVTRMQSFFGLVQPVPLTQINWVRFVILGRTAIHKINVRCGTG